MKEKEEKAIMREVLKDVDLNRFPFDEFWFDVGFQKAKEEFEKMIGEEFSDLDYVLNFREIQSEEEFLKWFNRYRETRKQELLTKIKEMGE